MIKHAKSLVLLVFWSLVPDIKKLTSDRRKYSDKKLEKEIEQTRNSRRENIVSKMRLGIIFTLLLINGTLCWFDYSSVELILKNNPFQIFTLIGLAIWIAYPHPETYDYVCSPRYLTTKEIKEIENDNFFSRQRNSQETIYSTREEIVLETK